MASSCPCQAGTRALGACWGVQATLQPDPLNQGQGRHSTPQGNALVAPACAQVSGPSLGCAALTPQLLWMVVRAQHLQLARNVPLCVHMD